MNNLSFEHSGKQFEIGIPVDTALRAELENAPHVYSFMGTTPPRGWEKDYYSMFLSHDREDPVISSILDQLRQLNPGASPDEYAAMAISFVQGAISYDWQTYYDLANSKIRYPYETLMNETGVCADKTILMARLLRALDYRVAIFSYKRANHMALGLAVPSGYGDYGTEYAFVESTNYTPIGIIPDRYAGGIRLDSRPQVTEIPSGTRSFNAIAEIKAEQKEAISKYGKEFLFFSPEMKALKIEMTELEAAMKEMKRELDKCRGTLTQARAAECQALSNQYNRRVEHFNGLVSRFNALSQERNANPPA